MNSREITTQISKAADFLNLKKWDYGASFSNDYSVQVDKGEAKQLKASQKQILTIRVWNQSNLVGITTTSDISESGIKKALKQANIASDFGNKNESTEFSPLAKDPIKVKEVKKRNPVGIKKLLTLLREAEVKLIESHESIKSVPYNGLSESFFERVYANSEGAFRSYSKSQAALYLYARAEEKNKKPRSSGSVKLGYGADDIDIESCIKEASNKTISHLNYSSIKTDKYLICFSPESFLTIINAFSSMFNARSIIDGVSLSNKNSIGEKLSTEALNIYDDGLHEKNISSLPFDLIVNVSSPLGVPSIFKYTQILSSPPNSGPDGPGRCKSTIVTSVAFPPLSENSKMKSDSSRDPVPLLFVYTLSEKERITNTLLVLIEVDCVFTVGGEMSCTV